MVARTNGSEKSRRAAILKRNLRESALREDEEIEIEADATEDVEDTADEDLASKILDLNRTAVADGVVTKDDIIAALEDGSADEDADEDFDDEEDADEEDLDESEEMSEDEDEDSEDEDSEDSDDADDEEELDEAAKARAQRVAEAKARIARAKKIAEAKKRIAQRKRIAEAKARIAQRKRMAESGSRRPAARPAPRGRR